MENGEWRMENGEWGKWRIENGEWRMVNGEWRIGETDPPIKRDFHDFVGAGPVLAPV
ncbi:MAG: hypothetical protein ACO394_05705 [Blastocatellia bacterium]